ncbi:MAG TPA: hypothetical protein DCL63_11635 [Firmicutes bacterium]|nr:hypothetical protein [Bacillota bacterium]
MPLSVRCECRGTPDHRHCGEIACVRPVPLGIPTGTWIFDAKFRLDTQTDGDGTAKFGDICKMHAYHDALRKCKGAYAAYPGDERIMYSPTRGQLGPEVAVAVDGVGAIPARPGEGVLSAAVRDAVRELLGLGA